MRDPRLVPETRKRIDNRDYEAVFAAGCCFHFALRLHERFDLKIRGIRVSADTHQRFESANPMDEKLYEEFRKNIGQS